MTVWTRDDAIRSLNEEEFISIGKRFTGVSSNDGSVGVVIENNNSHDIFVPTITLRSQFRGRVEKGFNPTVDTTASNLGFTNKKSSGADGASNVNAFTIGDGEPGAVTADGSNFNDKFLPAGGAVSPGTQAEVGGNIIAEGDSLFVRAVNESSNSGELSIDVDFIKTQYL